jgi:hypothetical protein
MALPRLAPLPRPRLQVLAAHALRPKPEAPKRGSWNNLHWWLGRTTLAVAAANVFVGIVLNNKKFAESSAPWVSGQLAVWLACRQQQMHDMLHAGLCMDRPLLHVLFDLAVVPLVPACDLHALPVPVDCTVPVLPVIHCLP